MAAKKKPDQPELKSFVVSCDCATPLSTNPAAVQAEDKDDAVAKFKELNGISDTDHPIQVVQGVLEKGPPKNAEELKESTKTN